MNGGSCLAAPTSRSAWIDEAVADAIALARLHGDGTAQVTVAFPVAEVADPAAAFASLPRGSRTLLWNAQECLLTCGSAWSVAADGPGRFAWCSRAEAALQARTIVAASAPGAPALPLMTLAATFEERSPMLAPWSGVPALRLTMPAAAWLCCDGRWWEIRSASVTRDDDFGAAANRLVAAPGATAPTTSTAAWQPVRDDYRELVDDAIALIGDGALRKVVIARAVDQALSTPVDEATLITRLRQAGGPLADVYAHDLPDGGLFLGATPELLLAREDARVRTMALAGTCRRSGDRALDAAAADQLLASTKQRKEHGLVVEHLASALRPRCLPFTIPAMPHRLDLPRLIHLQTDLSADLLRPDVLDLLAALHPTPAVCGLPVATAAHWIGRRERLTRGLYTGILGWLTPQTARLVVPLRGGVLSSERDRIRLYAGAGIVETSDRDDEWAETELKLEAMRGVLGG